MLTFHPLSMADKPWIDRQVAKENSRSADFNFGNLFLWDTAYPHWVADSLPCLTIFFKEDNKTFFHFPIGGGELAPVIEAMREYAVLHSFPFVLRGLEEHHAATLDCLFPGRFVFTEDRDYEDYLYRAKKLIDLSGKRLHGKRNHCNRFEAEHDWSFRALTPADFPDCISLLERWAAEESPELAVSIDGERTAILRAFAHYEALGLLGGALFAEGELVAYAIGEPISADTFDVHFEKARADLNGAYTMINREFVKLICETLPNICYVNREDDMGLENIRKSKRSYCPDILLRKFTARWKKA